ncbi:MAG TPA: DUF4199 domain-containing protein [Bacteroidales bacterium]|nr:DUF4199 domain-containing protein [Bacteroidales bacterium]
MEQKVNVWKANITNGVILALAGIVFSLVLYFLDLTFNKAIGYINIPIQLVILYFLLVSYRDNYLHGQISYGQSVGAGVVIFLYCSVLLAIYTYILWAVIDPGLAKKSLAMAEEAMVKRGTPQAAIDAGMAFTAKIMKPGIMAVFSIFGSMFAGVIFSLLVSIFVRREGNPLIDAPEN